MALRLLMLALLRPNFTTFRLVALARVISLFGDGIPVIWR
ncbi:hypothetical protein U91I_00549 [alpha proteobacterium U9-1i]|nr:hypothetical protein U91I_00549 [alpha proteobacterium U9-1i]